MSPQTAFYLNRANYLAVFAFVLAIALIEWVRYFSLAEILREAVLFTVMACALLCAFLLYLRSSSFRDGMDTPLINKAWQGQVKDIKNTYFVVPIFFGLASLVAAFVIWQGSYTPVIKLAMGGIANLSCLSAIWSCQAYRRFQEEQLTYAVLLGERLQQ